MRSIAAAAKDENERLISITEQTRRDSKSLKALTVVATMYLPASLVAVSLPLWHLSMKMHTDTEHFRASSIPALSKHILQTSHSLLPD